MAINFLNKLNFNQNELDKARIVNEVNDTAAGTPVDGQLYYDTTLNVLKVGESGAWKEVGGGVESLTTTQANNSTGNSLTVLNAAVGAVTINSFAYAGSTNVGYVPVGGSGTTFLRGDGTWVVPSNTIYTAAKGVVEASEVFSAAIVSTNQPTTANALSTTASRTYSVQTVTDNDGLLVVNIPWTDTAGAITTVDASTANNRLGIAVTPTTGDVKVGLNVVGLDLIGAADLLVGDVVPFYDVSAGKNKKVAISSIVAKAPQGTITSINEGNYIQIDDGGTPTPTINVQGTTAATANRLVARDANGFGQVQKPASGDSSLKIATTSFVQEAVVGNLQFKGGFNANTGALDSPLTTNLYTNTATAVGDYYVVTTAGNFFGNAATPLTPGDSVIAQKAEVAGSVIESDFIVVQSDTDLGTLTTPGLAGVINAASPSGTTTTVSSGMFTVKVDGAKFPETQPLVKIYGQDASGENTKETITSILSNNSKKIALTAGTGVVRSVVGGVVTYTVTTATAWEAGIVGTNLMIQVTASNGQSVYPDINRSSTTFTVAFILPNPVDVSGYIALCTNVGA